jgi:hypothetical protein
MLIGIPTYIPPTKESVFSKRSLPPGVSYFVLAKYLLTGISEFRFPRNLIWTGNPLEDINLILDVSSLT